MNIKVTESIKVNDKIYTYKRWLYKLIHFFTVKVLPPQK